TAWPAPLIVTLLNMTVSGLAGTLGASTARSPLWPAVWSATRWAKAMPTGPLFDPIMRSMWATSLPSPTSDSPTMKLWLSAIRSSRQSSVLSVWDADHNDPACEPPMHPLPQIPLQDGRAFTATRRAGPFPRDEPSGVRCCDLLGRSWCKTGGQAIKWATGDNFSGHRATAEWRQY